MPIRKIFTAVLAAALLPGTLLLSSCGQDRGKTLSEVSDTMSEDYHVKEGEAVAKPAKADKLYVYALGSDSVEAKKAAYALQGLINQKQAEVYLLTDGFPQDQEWLEELRGSYSEVVEVDIQEETGFQQLFKDYRDRIKKILIYDPSEEKDYTWNLAMTMGSLEGGLPMPAGLLRIIQSKVGYDGEVVDLTDRWESKEDAYEYMLRELLPRTSRQILYSLDPQAPLRTADYAMAARCAVVWFNEAKRDDREMLDKILGSGHYCENAILMGYGDASDGKSGDDLLNAGAPYGFGFVVSDWFANGSVFASIETMTMPQQRPGKAVPVEMGKTYVCMFWSDGDNIQYDQIGLKKAWNHPRRGEVPVASTVAPIMTELAPTILKWYHDNMTENDELIAGPSGWQFIYCSRYDSEKLKTWSGKNKVWLKNAGISVANMWRFDPITDAQTLETILTDSGIQAVFTPDVPALYSKAYDKHSALIFNAPGSLWNSKPGEMYDQVLSKFIAKPDEAKFVAVNNVLEGTLQQGTYDVILRETDYANGKNPDTFVFLRPSDFVATYREYIQTAP